MSEQKIIEEKEYENLLKKFDDRFSRFEQTYRSKKLASPAIPLEDGIRTDSVVLPEKKTLLNFSIFVVSKLTGICAFDGLYPECAVLTKETSVPRAVCIADPNKCHVGKNCIGTLLERLGNLAYAMPKIQVFVLHWRITNPDHIMGVFVDTNTSRMKMNILNPHALSYFVTAQSERYEVNY